MSKLPRSEYEAFVFASSPLYDAVTELLDEWVDDETRLALGATHTPESRAHACGRAEALLDLKAELEDRRSTAEAIRLRG